MKFVETKLTGRGGIQGASTITQQVAKNMLLTSERTFDRKIREAILATRIERAFSKDKILELYLNEIFLGIGAYGVAAAGLTYFSKELKDLTIEEAAYLAALPKAPSFYHPFRRTKEATARRNWIIDEMAGNGFITRAEADAAKAKPLTVNIRNFGAHVFASDFFAEDVRRTLLAQYGEDKLYGGGLSVRTTLDPKLQQYRPQGPASGPRRFRPQPRLARRGAENRRVSGDWGVRLAQIDVATDIAPWRLGVVLEVTRGNILVGLRPTSQQTGQQLTKEREAVRVAFEEMRWAGRFNATDSGKGRAPGPARRCRRDRRRHLGLAEGCRKPERPVVADADPRSRRRPAGDGPAYRPHSRGRRRLLLRDQPVRPRAAGQAPARLVLQAARLRDRARQRLQADLDRARRTDRDRIRRPAESSGSPRTTAAARAPARRRCAPASRSRAT